MSRSPSDDGSHSCELRPCDLEERYYMWRDKTGKCDLGCDTRSEFRNMTIEAENGSKILAYIDIPKIRR